MKILLRSIAGVAISIAILLSLYGSVKIARAKGGGDVLVDEDTYKRQIEAANKAFSYSGVLFVGSIFLFGFSRNVK